MAENEFMNPHVNDYYRGTMWLSSKIAYLIGVKDQFFGDAANYEKNVFDELEKNENSKRVRLLCSIRTTVMQNLNTVDNNLKYGLTDLAQQSLCDPAWFTWLLSHGVAIRGPYFRASQYLLDLNDYIVKFSDSCKEIFPSWINWSYISDLFEMPCDGKESKTKDIARVYRRNLMSYPYQAYMNWPITNPAAYDVNSIAAMFSDPNQKQAQEGNVLYNDQKFITLLYRINHDEFSELWRFRDAAPKTKATISSFLSSHQKIDIVVDCENADPFKLVSFIRSVEDICDREDLNSEDISHINKVLLFDDVHTADTWQLLSNCVDVPVDYSKVSRVKQDKSLVDATLIAETCKEYYKENVDGFILASSDSDFYAMINSLSGADFFVCLESEKRSTLLTKALDEINTPYCYMDDFTDRTEDIKQLALMEGLKKYVREHVQLNISDIIESLALSTGITFNERDRQRFIDSYLKEMVLIADSSGELGLKLTVS